MKIENMTFDQLNACFSLLITLIRHISIAGESDSISVLIELEKKVGAAMSDRIDEMLGESAACEEV